MSVHWVLTTAMLMLLVPILLEVSFALATQAFKEMALPVKVRQYTEQHNGSNKRLVCALDTLAINECALGTDNCNANAACTDTEGSFTCSCNSGYQGDGVTCTSMIVFTLLKTSE